MSNLEVLLAEQLAQRVEDMVRERLAAASDPLFGKAALQVDEAARALSVDESTVRRYIRARILEAVQPIPGGLLLVPVWSIRRLLGERYATPQEDSGAEDAPPQRRRLVVPKG